MPVDAMSFQSFQSRAPAQVSGRPKRRNNQVARTPDYGYAGPPIATTGPIAGESSHQREVRIQSNIAERRRRMAMPGVAGTGAGTQTQDPFPAQPGPQNVVPIREQYYPAPQSSGRPAFDPNASVYGRPQIGGGYVDAPDLRNSQLSPQDQRQVDMDRRWQQADPAGPYSNIGGYNRFQSLPAHQPNVMQPPAPEWQQGHLDAADASQRRARGRSAAFVQTGPPAGGLSPEMEDRRQIGIERRAGERDALARGRRDRAIRQNGLTHLQPSYANAPLDSMRYGRAGTGVGGGGQQRGPAFTPRATDPETGEVAALDVESPEFNNFLTTSMQMDPSAFAASIGTQNNPYTLEELQRARDELKSSHGLLSSALYWLDPDVRAEIDFENKAIGFIDEAIGIHQGRPARKKTRGRSAPARSSAPQSGYGADRAAAQNGWPSFSDNVFRSSVPGTR